MSRVASLDSFMASLHCPNGRQIACWSCARYCHWPLKNVWISPSLVSPHCIAVYPESTADEAFPILFRPANHKSSDGSQLEDTDSPTDTRRGLWNSLLQPGCPWDGNWPIGICKSGWEHTLLTVTDGVQMCLGENLLENYQLKLINR